MGVFKPKDEEPYGRNNPKWTKWFVIYFEISNLCNFLGFKKCFALVVLVEVV